jgi:DNA ligase (NAD+)
MQDKNPPRIEVLASQILLFKKLYYTGSPSISDEAYDALEDELKVLDPHHPVLAMVGYPLGVVAGKVSHVPPMLSLAKTYELNDLLSFLNKYPSILSDKLDGMAMALEYDSNGNLFRASTRGSGKAGENVTEHIFHVSNVPKKVTLPPALQGLFIEVRGEVYFPVSLFPPFAERFDSYRNAVPGTFGRKEVGEAIDVLRVLKFCAYDLIIKDAEGNILGAREAARILKVESTLFSLKLELLESLNFYTGLQSGFVAKINPGTLEELGETIANWYALPRDYQIDGIVARIDDEVIWESLGTTSHHPRGSVAFKQSGEIATTAIIAIEESVGRSGKITFRARLEPVQLSGAKITFATLHNAEFIEAGGYAPGAIVKIKRSGEVIPAIIGLHEAAPTPYVIPATCPCGYPVQRQGPDLYCGEKRTCPPKDQESLVYFVHCLDILGISDKIIHRLRESGLVTEPADLFKLTEIDVLQIEGFAKKSAENLIRALSEKRSLPLAMFLTSLGLKRGGAVKCQDVARRFKTLDAVRSATAEALMEEKGWAQKSAEDFVASLQEKSQIIDNLLKYIEIVPDESGRSLELMSSHPFFGKSVCITGSLARPREEYKARLEQVGAKLVSAVSSKTHFLVCNEASGSEKYRQAQKLGVPIFTEVEFEEKL